MHIKVNCPSNKTGKVIFFFYPCMEQHLLSHLDRHIHGEGTERRVPMIVPDRQMQSLMIICAAEEADTLVAGEKIRKFEKGQLVRVIDGTFAGVVGRVARFMGQQRVAIYLEGLLSMTTAYAPNDFLEPFDDPATETPLPACSSNR